MDELQPFKVEVAWLRRYAEILESRHRGLLSFRWDLAPETLATLTPRLLLQPLVENAVKHGALRRREGGSVLIRSESLGGGIVRLVVEDNGPGFGSDSAERLGITLVRRRLGLMCPGGSLHIEPIDPGTRAVVEIQQAMEGCA
jgi:LytS/YehU family sensor histidine kinase